jgi:hypothetical protein
MSSLPADLNIVYHWAAGSMPPPYHYEYEIRITPPDQGEIVFWPGYPGSGTPRWRETFRVAAEDVARLYALLRRRAVFTTSWLAPGEPPIGGATAWMTVTANGQRVDVPASVVPEQAELLSVVYQAIRALVPPDLWAQWETRRQLRP